MTLLDRRRSHGRALGSEWTLRIIWAARVAMSAGRALTAIVVPLYLAADGFSGFRLGLLFLGVGLTSAVLSSLSGLLSDRVGRKPFLVVFPLITAAAGLVFAYTTAAPVLAVAAALGSFGRGGGAGSGIVGPYQPAESALVSEVARPARRNVVFGRLAFGSGIGALCGGLLATLAGSRAGFHSAQAALLAYRPAFLVTAGVSCFAGVVALWLREPPRPRTPGRRGRLRLPRASRPLLARLWLTNSVNGLAVGMFAPFVSYWFYVRFGASATHIGLLYAAVNAATLVSTLNAARLADRWGLIRTVAAVRTLAGLLLVPMVLAGSFWVAGAWYLLRMLIQRVGLPLRQSYVLAMADPAERASVAALSNLPAQALMSVSPVASGYLLDEVALALPFEISGALQVVNAGLYWLLFRRRPPEEEAAPDPSD